MLKATVGQAKGVNGREACVRAIEQARQSVRQMPVRLAIIFASEDFNAQEVLGGAMSQIRNAPLFGFSTQGTLTHGGQHEHSVVVALLVGNSIEAQAYWWQNFAEDSRKTAREMSEKISWGNGEEETLLLAADGIYGDADVLCNHLSEEIHPIIGGLTGGIGSRPSFFQMGGSQAGEKGLSAVVLKGNIKTGVGSSHGWQDIGVYFQITHSEGPWIRTLNDQPASEVVSRLFGRQPRDWMSPPLDSMIRLYPLGLEQEDNSNLLIRSPIRVEADGSLRMGSEIPAGQNAHLMVGSNHTCYEAARQASQQALEALEGARLRLALVLADIAWKPFFESQSGEELDPIRQVLGMEVPIAGGYTVGQIVPSDAGKPSLLNQHIVVIAVGETA